MGLGLLAGVLLLYAPVRTYDFVAYDDPHYVRATPRSEPGLTWTNLRRFCHEPVAGNWQPLTMVSHLLDVELFGLWPAGHHIHSLLLHGLNAVLLFLVLSRLTGARWPALAVAALWAVHPVNADSVVWIAERKNLLSTLFWLATIGFYARYVRRPSPGTMAAVCASFVLALLAKPMPVTLPFTLLLLDLWPLRRVEGFGRGMWPVWKKLVAEKIPLFILVLVFIGVTLKTQVQAGATTMGPTLPLGARLAWTPVFYLDYLRLFFWPVHLSVLYPRPAGAPTLFAMAGAVLALGLVTVAVLRKVRRSPWWTAGWFWFLGTLVPVIGVVSIGLHRIADRYLYVPMIGLLMAVVWTGQVLGRGRGRIAVAGLALAAVTALAVATRIQLPRWRNSETLFRSALENTDNNFFMHYELARQLARQGQFDDAIAHLEEAKRIHPDHALANNNLGCLLLMKGESFRALSYLEESLHQHPAVETRVNLARALVDLGRYEDACEQYRLALEEQPDNMDARKGLRMAEHRLRFPPPYRPVSRISR